MSIEMQAEVDEANIVDFRDTFNTVKSRVSAGGAFVTHVNGEPNASTLANGECAWWFDATQSPFSVKFIAKNSSGTVLKGEVTMS